MSDSNEVILIYLYKLLSKAVYYYNLKKFSVASIYVKRSRNLLEDLSVSLGFFKNKDSIKMAMENSDILFKGSKYPNNKQLELDF